MKIALKVNDKDNCATVFAQDIKDKTELKIMDKQGNGFSLSVIGDVPYGHKVAIMDIKKATPIIKYGEELGVSSSDIKKGEYIHVHNLESMRGRGDL